MNGLLLCADQVNMLTDLSYGLYAYGLCLRTISVREGRLTNVIEKYGWTSIWKYCNSEMISCINNLHVELYIPLTTRTLFMCFSERAHTNIQYILQNYYHFTLRHLIINVLRKCCSTFGGDRQMVIELEINYRRNFMLSTHNRIRQRLWLMTVLL